jgi:hypothetical protein
MSSSQAAARLAPAIEAGATTIREALGVVLPSGVGGLFAEGSVAAEEIARYEVMLVDLVRTVGLERAIAGLEQAAREDREDAEPGREGGSSRDASTRIRWIGGCRRLHSREPALCGTWIAWVVEEHANVVVTLDLFDDAEVEMAAEAQLREAIALHRGKPAEPIAGLYVADPMLAAVARRVVGDEYPIDTRADGPTVEPAWVDFRAEIGRRLRWPVWWQRLGDPTVSRLLLDAARLFAAAPWKCGERTAIIIDIPGRPKAIVRAADDGSEPDEHTVVFTIGDNVPKTGLDLLVVSFVEESLDAAAREHLCHALFAAGWEDLRWFPHVQIHRGAELDVELQEDDFVHASALCQTLVHALAEVHGRSEGLVEGTAVVLDGSEPVTAKYMILWFEQ